MVDHGNQTEGQAGAAARARRYRARRRGGVRLANVDVCPEVLWALVTSGWIDHAEAGDPLALGRAVAALLDTWTCGTLQVPGRNAVTPKDDTPNRRA